MDDIFFACSFCDLWRYSPLVLIGRSSFDHFTLLDLASIMWHFHRTVNGIRHKVRFLPQKGVSTLVVIVSDTIESIMLR